MALKHNSVLLQNLPSGLRCACLLGLCLASSLTAAKDPLVILNNNRLVADVVEGTIVHENIIVSNTTANPLKIINIRATCGCTVMGNTEYTLNPYAVASIKYDFKSATYIGKIDRRIILSISNQIFPFQFTVYVRPILKLSQDNINIDGFQPGRVLLRKVAISVGSNTPDLILENIVSDTNIVRIKLQKDKRGLQSLIITCTPPDVETFNQNIRLLFKIGDIKKNIPLSINGKRKN